MGHNVNRGSSGKAHLRILVGVLAIFAAAWAVTSYRLHHRVSLISSKATAPRVQSSTPPDVQVLIATPRVPRPSTLDPSTFKDPEIRAAYQAAKDVPEVLEHLPCYCGCMRNAGHQSNLDCFLDEHGTQCGLCRAIAKEGKREHDRGIPIDQIVRNVNQRFAVPAAP